MKIQKQYLHKKINGFSLVEIAMVLLIIGIIAGSALKGRDVIESAQIRSVASDVENIRMAYVNYVDMYGAPPGNDANAATRFPGESNGDGRGKYSEADAGRFFRHLYAAGLISDASFKRPKIGGEYTIIVSSGKAKLQISDNGGGCMTYKQVSTLKAKIIDSVGIDIVETDPEFKDPSASTKYIVKIAVN